jgi:hypothetical protein
MGSLLVFYVSYILDDKNTLCNGCYLNMSIGLNQNLQVLWTMFISSHVPWHKFLEDVHEDLMQISSQLTSSCATVWTGLWRRPDTLQCLEALALKTFGHQGNTVQTLGQASPISTWSWISVDTYLGSFCKTSGRCGNLFGRYPAFQNISGFLYECENEL